MLFPSVAFAVSIHECVCQIDHVVHRHVLRKCRTVILLRHIKIQRCSYMSTFDPGNARFDECRSSQVERLGWVEVYF